MYIYAFGSICRGEISNNSDIDILAVVEGHDSRFNSDEYSVYSYKRIEELWKEGNPFSWHLFYESRPIFLSNNMCFLSSLGKPRRYSNGLNDCLKFKSIFEEARDSLNSVDLSPILDLSTVFLSIRNFATCYSLSNGSPSFSRNSAKKLGTSSIALSDQELSIYERARILSTRGKGTVLTENEKETGINNLSKIEKWMCHLLGKMRNE